jgi:hypothetical protein
MIKLSRRSASRAVRLSRETASAISWSLVLVPGTHGRFCSACGAQTAIGSVIGTHPAPLSTRRQRAAALFLDLVPHRAAREVVVDEPTGLHQRVCGRRPDEPKAAPFELAGQGGRLGGRPREVRAEAGRVPPLGAEGPDQLRQRLTHLAEAQRGAGILDRGLDLGAIADDPLVGQQPLQVCVTEGRDAANLESGECGSEGLALAKDRQPREAGLERLQAEALIETSIVEDRAAPLAIVVADVLRRGSGPPATRAPVGPWPQRRLGASAQRPSSAASIPAARRASERSVKGRQRTIRPSLKVNSAAASFSSATWSSSSQRHCCRSSATT